MTLFHQKVYEQVPQLHGRHLKTEFSNRTGADSCRIEGARCPYKQNLMVASQKTKVIQRLRRLVLRPASITRSNRALTSRLGPDSGPSACFSLGGHEIDCVKPEQIAPRRRIFAYGRKAQPVWPSAQIVDAEFQRTRWAHAATIKIELRPNGLVVE